MLVKHEYMKCIFKYTQILDQCWMLTYSKISNLFYVEIDYSIEQVLNVKESAEQTIE